jgi:hypothetical protein
VMSLGVGSAGAEVFPVGYYVEVGHSGSTASGSHGGSGYLDESDTNYGEAEECAPEPGPGPFSLNFYPPENCAQVGRSYAASGATFLYTGNQNCAEVGRPLSGATFTWHVEIYVPNWTQYGENDVYVSSSADGASERTINDQAEFGRWVPNAFGSHHYDETTPYTVELIPRHDNHCYYEPASQVRWVYDGPSSPSATVSSPPSGGSYPEGALVRTHFSCAEAFAEALESCIDSNGVSAGSGALDTSKPGLQSYTVTAKGTAGATGTAEIVYTVLPAKESCTSDQAKITLTPGLSDDAVVQSVKVSGTLAGCSPGAFSSAKYTAKLKTSEPAGCGVLHEGAASSGMASVKWLPKAQKSTSAGSFALPLGEAPESELTGTLASGPFSPSSVYGTVTESFVDASECGMSVRGKVKPVRRATLTGTRFVLY